MLEWSYPPTYVLGRFNSTFELICERGHKLMRHRPIPRQVCYSLDSTFCKQLKKLSILNDIHILIYHLHWTYMHIVSIGK